MNVEIEVPGLRIKVEYTEKKHVERIINAVMHYSQGGKFTDVYDVAQAYVKKEKEGPKSFIPESNGIKDYGNGKLGYKCTYRCTCGHKGVRYPCDKEEYVHCHKCNEKLNMIAAHENEAHDEEYNYFLAM